MVWKSESEGAVWEWAKDVVSKAATRTAGKRKVVSFIRDPFFTRDMPPDSTCERGRWFRDPVLSMTMPANRRSLHFAGCAALRVEMTGGGN